MGVTSYGRQYCSSCRKTKTTCYCAHLRPIELPFKVVFLVHPKEARRPVATARMAHLNLSGSLFITDECFCKNPEVTKLLNGSENYCTLLYPSHKAFNINNSDDVKTLQARMQQRTWVLFVLDATWHLAKKMLEKNPFLQNLDSVSFQSSRTSSFKIRKQPHSYCLSTIEAIDEFVQCYSPKLHDNSMTGFLDPFHHMVNQQIGFEENSTEKSQFFESRVAN